MSVVLSRVITLQLGLQNLELRAGLCIVRMHSHLRHKRLICFGNYKHHTAQPPRPASAHNRPSATP